MQFRGGISGTRVAVVDAKVQDKDAVSPKLEGISHLNNFELTKAGLKVWRAYNTGPGKVLPWKLMELDVISTFPNIESPFPALKTKEIKARDPRSKDTRPSDDSSNTYLLSC